MPCTGGEPAGWPAPPATDAVRSPRATAPVRPTPFPPPRGRRPKPAPRLAPVRSRRNTSVGQRLVDELAQLRAYPVGAGREQLGEERDGQLLLRVDPERRAGGAAPGKLPSRADHLARHWVDDHGEPQAEADPAERELGIERPAERVQIEAARKMVAGHVADRSRAQQPDTVQLPGWAVRTVQQHLGE